MSDRKGRQLERLAVTCHEIERSGARVHAWLLIDKVRCSATLWTTPDGRLEVRGPTRRWAGMETREALDELNEPGRVRLIGEIIKAVEATISYLGDS